MTPALWAAVAVVLLVTAALVSGNHLIALRATVRQALADIDVQLERRHVLIPRLVAAVQGSQAHERLVFEQAARAAEAGAAGLARGDVAEQGRLETALSAAVRDALVLVEANPVLRSHANIVRFQEDLVSTENRVAFARQHYNDAALLLNDAVQVFPRNVVARIFRVVPAAYLALELVHEPVVVRPGAF